MLNVFLSIWMFFALSTWTSAQERGPEVEIDPAYEVDVIQTVHNFNDFMKKHVRRVEFYYNTTDAQLHELGVDTKIVTSDCVLMPSICQNGAKYFRVGVLDLSTQVVRAADGKTNVEINKGEISLFQWMMGSGTYVNVFRMSYIDNNRSKYVNYMLPVTFISGAQNVDFRIDKNGVLKLYFQIYGEMGIADTKFKTEKGEEAVGGGFFNLGGEGGLKLTKLLTLGATSRFYRDKMTFEREHGARARVNISDKISLNLQGNLLNRELGPIRRDTNVKELPASLVGKQESYWYAGAGLQIDF